MRGLETSKDFRRSAFASFISVRRKSRGAAKIAHSKRERENGILFSSLFLQRQASEPRGLCAARKAQRERESERAHIFELNIHERDKYNSPDNKIFPYFHTSTPILIAYSDCKMQQQRVLFLQSAAAAAAGNNTTERSASRAAAIMACCRVHNHKNMHILWTAVCVCECALLQNDKQSGRQCNDGNLAHLVLFRL